MPLSSGRRLGRVALFRCSAAWTSLADSLRRDRFGGMLGVGYGNVFPRADCRSGRIALWRPPMVIGGLGPRLRQLKVVEVVGGRMTEGWKAGGAAHDPDSSLFAIS
jgi:hypothetical protein